MFSALNKESEKLLLSEAGSSCTLRKAKILARWYSTEAENSPPEGAHSLRVKFIAGRAC
jgi:hypothetical protein